MNDIYLVSGSTPDAERKRFRITFANLDDVDALVALHLQCFSGDDHIAVLFGENYIRAVYKWFVIDPKTFVLVAKSENKLIGLTALADRPYGPPMLLATKKEALRTLLKRPWLAFHPELLIRLFRIFFPKHKCELPGTIAHIAFTAVDEEFRRMGIAKALKRESIRVCRERGMKAILTGVKKVNMRAKAMNENAGFVEVPELSTRRFFYLKLDLDHGDPKDQDSLGKKEQWVR